MKTEIELGQKVKCRISGFKGVAIAITEYINGCKRVAVQPPVSKDGTLPKAQHFDEPELEVTSKKHVLKKVSNTGGPRSHTVPPRR